MSLTPNNDSTTLAVPKLCDDRSNWANYEPRLCKVRKTAAREEQIESKETKIKNRNTM